LSHRWASERGPSVHQHAGKVRAATLSKDVTVDDLGFVNQWRVEALRK
jgi:hypothetical protein